MDKESKKEILETVKIANEDEELVASWRETRNQMWKEQSIEEGAREEGKKEGKQEGIKIGEEIGEAKKEKSFIKKMLNKKFDYSVISDITGKSISEIKEIASSI